MKNMTREQFMDLFNLTESDAGMEYADEEVANGSSYFEVAKANITTMNHIILNNK